MQGQPTQMRADPGPADPTRIWPQDAGFNALAETEAALMARRASGMRQSHNIKNVGLIVAICNSASFADLIRYA